MIIHLMIIIFRLEISGDNADQKFSEFLAISNLAAISASAIKVMFRASTKLCENSDEFFPAFQSFEHLRNLPVQHGKILLDLFERPIFTMFHHISDGFFSTKLPMFPTPGRLPLLPALASVAQYPPASPVLPLGTPARRHCRGLQPGQWC